MKEAEFLVRLFHHRWTVPVLSSISSSGGGRVVSLTHSLGASRGGVRQALGSLLDLGLVERNPGHGHPLRPEYLLTARGASVAREAERIVQLTDRWSIQPLAFRKWPLPVTYGLGDEGARFSELRTRLPGITDRALSDALRSLAGSELAERQVQTDGPIEVAYRPTARAGELLVPLRSMATAA